MINLARHHGVRETLPDTVIAIATGDARHSGPGEDAPS